MSYQCEMCGKGIPEGVTLFRINKPGEMPARWLCHIHAVTGPGAEFEIDRDIIEFAAMIDPRVLEKPPEDSK